jgi:hypothetical protein
MWRGMRRYEARSWNQRVQRPPYTWLFVALGLGLASVLARALRRLRPRQPAGLQPTPGPAEVVPSEAKLSARAAADVSPPTAERSETDDGDSEGITSSAGVRYAEEEASPLTKRLVLSLLPPYGERRRREQWEAAYLASFRRERDPESNAESTPPEGERIELHSLWLAEVYSPSTVANLIQGLQRLGWASDVGQRLGEVNLADWVTNSRASPLSVSWTTIGPIMRPGRARFLGAMREAVLPEGVDYALGSLSTVTPSATVLVIQFVFTDQVAQAFDASLRRTYETFPQVRNPRFTAYITPGDQKQDAMLTARRAIRGRCADWFHSNLPGVFSSGLNAGGFPSCEFITTQVAVPFEREPLVRPDNYMFRLGLASDFGAWQTDNLPGLRLRLPWPPDEDPFALLVAGRYDDIFRDDNMQEAYGGRTRQGLANHVEQYIGRTIVTWALRATLIGYQSRLAQLRDRATLPEGKTRAAIRALDSVREQLLLTSADSQRISKDLGTIAEQKQWYCRLFETDFEPIAANRRERESSLIEVLRGDTLRRARTLSETEQHVREVLWTSSNLASAAANLRVQRRITTLTFKKPP